MKIVESRYLDAMRHMGLADCIQPMLLEVLYGGWLESNLWEQYGNIVNPEDYFYDRNTERRLYVHTAKRVLASMRLAGSASRAGTHYRIASAVIHELTGATTHPCGNCKGAGKCKRPGRVGEDCKHCEGSGKIGPSMTVRADACGCRRPEFRLYLLGPYLTTLSYLTRELEIARKSYAKISACPLPTHEFALS